MIYIVKLVSADSFNDIVAKHRLTLTHTYSSLPEFFAIDCGQTTVNALLSDSSVAYVLPNNEGEFTVEFIKENTEPLSLDVSASTFSLNDAVQPSGTLVQTTAQQWHLNYLSKKYHTATPEPLTGTYKYERSGAGVDVYVMDSGCYSDHLDFQDPTTGLYTRVVGIPGWTSPVGNHLQDGLGHGTHVCGLIGGKFSGVAKSCQLYMARIFNDTGASISSADTIAAFNAIIAHHTAKAGSRPSLLNMSIGASPSVGSPYVYYNEPSMSADDYMDDMVEACVAAGITVCIAAGNGFVDAAGAFLGRMNSRYVRPARVETVITVGALDNTSTIANFSNYGRNVDVFAPGVSLYSAHNTVNTGLNIMSGTSQACPVVTGICALYLEENPTSTPTQVRSAIIDKCSTNGQVRGLDTAYQTDGVITSGTTIQWYNYQYYLLSASYDPYPSFELTANRAVFSPYCEQPRLAARFKASRSAVLRHRTLTSDNIGTVVAPPAVPGLWSFGYNNRGQLGVGDLVNRSVPTQVGALTNWLRVAQGQGQSVLAVKTDGSLWSWGYNPNGELGDNTISMKSSPVQVGALTGWGSLSSVMFVGSSQAAIVKTAGSLFTWGYGATGALGSNSLTSRSSPVQVGALTTWTSLAAGPDFTIGISGGKLYVWGDNTYGHLGVTGNRSSPTQVGALTNWANIGVGYFYIWYGVKTDGTAWYCGRGIFGQNGNPSDGVDVASPVQIGTDTNWKQITGGNKWAVGLKTDGTLWSWGTGNNGELGTGTVGGQYTPTKIGTATDWASISVGANHAVARKTDGSVWTWGYNAYGQLGLGDMANRSVPTKVGNSAGWASAYAVGNSTFVTL